MSSFEDPIIDEVISVGLTVLVEDVVSSLVFFCKLLMMLSEVIYNYIFAIPYHLVYSLTNLITIFTCSFRCIY